LTFNAVDSDVTCVISVDGNVVGSYNASTLADGGHTVSITDTDVAGNTKTASTSFTLDTTLTAPTASLTDDSGSDHADKITNNAALTFNAADGDATRVISVDGNVVGSYDASTLADGGHTVNITDTDVAGNTKTASTSFTLDTTLTAPTASLTDDSGSDHADTITNNAALTFNAADGDATRVISVDGNVVGSYDASTLADGGHTVSITDTDVPGNTKTASTSFPLDTSTAAPAVALANDTGNSGTDGITSNGALSISG